MRIGIFGGTFDPIHLGHLILVEQCRDQANLDQVLFIPAASPPHKQQQALTPFDKRVEMLKLAISGHAAFRVEELEKERTGPSYTVDTLTQLQSHHPGDDLYFILGSDSLQDLPMWREPRRILELASLIVMERADWPPFSAEKLREALKLEESFALRYQVVAAPLITISSRDLRRRFAEGRSVRYMLPRAVEAYVQEKGLYRA